ncbi:hypothetical protein CDAR_446111 [Caerostris darwini]|uniref:Uncharacterized protein n=1 Tax=Caerostris darwini TaxID=1538125 RepID=A0AAV4SLR1_9ARAC|nr:hypothetical protein CDAR_446111 [Caerostris darwini]
MLPLVSDNFTSLGGIAFGSTPITRHDYYPRAGNSALFEAGIDEPRFMQAEKDMSSLKKNAYSVHEREKVEVKTAWKRLYLRFLALAYVPEKFVDHFTIRPLLQPGNDIESVAFEEVNILLPSS